MVNKKNGQGLTGATVTVKRLMDNGNQQDAEGIVTEKGNCQYNFAYTANDINASVVGLLMLADDAIPVHFIIGTD